MSTQWTTHDALTGTCIVTQCSTTSQVEHACVRVGCCKFSICKGVNSSSHMYMYLPWSMVLYTCSCLPALRSPVGTDLSLGRYFGNSF